MKRSPVILAVDDDPDYLEAIRQVLRLDPSYEVLTATSGAQGLEVAERIQPALILSDEKMKGMTGIEFCRQIRSRPDLADTMFILVTGVAETSSTIRGLDAGADDYITKPCDADVLLSKVRAFLRIKALQEELKEDKRELQRLNEALSTGIQGISTLLVNIISLRVPNAAARAEKAYRLATWIGERLEIPAEEVEVLGIAARIHEIGKINMPDEMLSKPADQLTPEDRETLVHAPIFGQMLVANVHQIRDLGKTIRHQLENYDGTGYPDRLLHEQIPLGSRILRLIAVLEDIPASTASATERLLERIRSIRGTILDPKVALLAEEYLETRENPSWLEGKREIGLPELEEGMVIAADLSTASGLKLLSKDSRLSKSQIERIFSHHRTDPIVNRVYIYDAV